MSEQAEEVQTEELSPAEEQAISNGWKPKEEWDGDESQWVPAEEFNRRGEMIGNIIKEQKRNAKLDKEVKELRDSIKALSEHNKKVKEQAKKEALEELKNLKKEALRENDVDSVIEIDDKIEAIKSAPVEDTSPTETSTKETPQEVVDWLEANQGWYNEQNTVLKNAFDGIVIALVNENPEYTEAPEEVLQIAMEQMRSEFPDKFGEDKKRTAQKKFVEPTPAKGKTTSKYSVSRMTAEQRRTAERMISSGADITLEQYAQQLGEIGELK